MEEIAAGMDGTKAPKSVPVRGKDKKLAATDKEQLDIFVEHFILVSAHLLLTCAHLRPPPLTSSSRALTCAHLQGFEV